MIKLKLDSILNSLDEKLEEFATKIADFPETKAEVMDLEEVVYYLNDLKNKIEILLIIVGSDR